MALPFVLGAGIVANFRRSGRAPCGGRSSPGMMAAMVSVLWAYDGWTNVTPLAEEIRDPGRNIPASLIWGMAVLIAVYLGMTLAYHYVLPMRRDRVGQPRGRACREGGRRRLLHGICWGGPGSSPSRSWSCARRSSRSTATRLTGPRAYFAMARDGLFPGRALPGPPEVPDPGQCDPRSRDLGDPPDCRRHVPDRRPAARGEPALPRLILAAWKKLNETPLYDLLYTYVIFGANIFYMLAIASVFVLRVRRPDLPRPYRTLGLSADPPALRGRRAAVARQHARGPSEPGAVAGGTRHHPASVCRPTGSSGSLPGPVRISRRFPDKSACRRPTDTLVLPGPVRQESDHFRGFSFSIGQPPESLMVLKRSAAPAHQVERPSAL